MDPLLERARSPFGEKRFFAPGSHPATARMREHLRLLELYPDSPEVRKTRDHLGTKIAAFEEGESLAKHDFLRAISA